MSENDFKKVYYALFNQVRTFIFSKSGDADLSEDLTQEVFIKAWEKLNTFKFECKFYTWLHSIAVNQFMMHLRSSKRKSDKEDEFEREIKQEGSKYTADSRIDLQKAIEKLPDQARMVLILHDIEGYKHNEISEMMDIQTGTSKAHLHRARKILREELSK